MMAAANEPVKKRQKYEALEKVKSDSKIRQNLKDTFYNVCNNKENPLVVLEITSCNAVADFGFSFSSAMCVTKPYKKELYPFGSVFVTRHGIALLKSFLEDPDYLPDDNASSV